MDFNKSILRSPVGSSWRTWFEYGFQQAHIEIPRPESSVAAQWFLVVMVWIWILTSPYLDPPIWSYSNKSWHLGGHGLNMDFINFHIEIPRWELLVDMVWIWVLTSPYWDPPSRVQSCSALIPGGHGLIMDFNKFIFRSTHPELQPGRHGLDMDFKSILRSPGWSCDSKIPCGHGFHMDSKKSMWRSTHLAFLVDMVSIWILISPCGDPPIWSSSNVWWQRLCAYPDIATFTHKESRWTCCCICNITSFCYLRV